MPGWIAALLRTIVLALIGSAIGGGILLWLDSNGIDLRRRVADVLSIAQSPEYRFAALVALSFAIGAVLVVIAYVVRQALANSNRPALSTARALRKALVDVREHALDFLPNETRSNAALRELRLVTCDLEPFPRYCRRVVEILETADTYLTHLTPGLRTEQESEHVALVHERALQAVEELMAETSWAARGD